MTIVRRWLASRRRWGPGEWPRPHEVVRCCRRYNVFHTVLLSDTYASDTYVFHTCLLSDTYAC